MLSDTQLALVEEICREKSENKRLSEQDVLKSLNFVLFDNRKFLESAVELINEDVNCTVKQFNSISCSRKCWTIKGSHDTRYLCLEAFCSCPSFLNQAKQIPGKVMCKHLFAIKLATVLGRISVETVSDEQFVDIICAEQNKGTVVSSFKPYAKSWRK